MSAKKVFAYGTLVRVKEPGQRSFIGKVYSEYAVKGAGQRPKRVICVIRPTGAGVAYPLRQINHIKARKPRRKG